jgi:hypothetical protein
VADATASQSRRAWLPKNFRQHGIFIVLESGALPLGNFGGDLLK